MKTLLIILVVLLSSCASQKLPYAGMPIDSIQQVDQIKFSNREAVKLYRRTVTPKTMKFVCLAVFGTYCILAWRYEIE